MQIAGDKVSRRCIRLWSKSIRALESNAREVRKIRFDLGRMINDARPMYCAERSSARAVSALLADQDKSIDDGGNDVESTSTPLTCEPARSGISRGCCSACCRMQRRRFRRQRSDSADGSKSNL